LISFKVTIYSIEPRQGRKTTYRVRWVVAGNRFGESFAMKQLAEAYRASLITAAGNGEGFDTETGLPVSMERKRRDVSFYQHALDFTVAVWPAAAAKTRVSIIEALARVVPVVVRDLAGAPSPDVLRRALRKQFNQGGHAGELDEDEAKAIGWIKKASRPLSAFEDASVVCDVLDALAVKLDGKPAAPEYFSRRRRVLHRALGYAVRKKRLEKNPLSKGNLPEDWTPPQAPDGTVDPRAVGSPALVADMLQACRTIGKRQGPRFVAFYGCMFYALMRPSEVAALTREACHLPDSGWGYLIFTDASPAAGRAYTDDGQVHEHRGLKGRTKGRPGPRGRRPVRKVPIPPELAELPRAHIAQFGVAQDGRLFRSENRTPLQPSTWWQVWQKVRAASLTPEQIASPLMKRPYDLRHSGVTWRLNSGVPPAEVAAWAGHSVEVLMRTYGRCVTGMEDVWIARMDKTLHPEENQ
jgi:integrase